MNCSHAIPIRVKRNCGYCYRLQVFDDRSTGMHWQTHKQGAEHYRRMRAAQSGNDSAAPKRMDIAVAIGADPATMYSAILPLPPDLDEMMIAGFLRSKPVEMVKCETSDLEVPAQAEIVLEGYVELGELRREGPFGDHRLLLVGGRLPCLPRHMRHASQESDLRDHHRRSAAHGGFLYGQGDRAHLFTAHASPTPGSTRRIAMPAEGNLSQPDSLVAIRKSYPGHARKVMHAIWGLGQAMFSKCIVVVDEDVDVQNVSEVAWKALNNIDPERDIQFVLGPVDSLDHASRLPNFGSKMGIDATRKWPEEGFCARPWPGVIRMSDDVRRRVDRPGKRARDSNDRLKTYGGCSSVGSSARLWFWMSWVQIPPAAPVVL